MARKKYRSQAGIILDILEALSEKGPLPPTRLMYAANLPYNRLKEVLARLESKSLVGVDEEGRYYLTEKGAEALKRLREARILIEHLGYKL